MTSSSKTTKVIKAYLSALDCPRALTAWLLFCNNEHDQLSQLETKVADYCHFTDFKNAYAATSYLSKSRFLNTSFNKRDVALAKFAEAESACALINRRGYRILDFHPGAEWIHNEAVRKIDRLLGEFEPEEMVSLGNWGPGNTILTKRDTSSVNKFRNENGTTRPLYDLMGGLYALVYPTWDLSKQQIQNSSKVVTVPKNSKTDRTIAIEPGLNLWFQKAIGSMIRRRLRRVGIDLNNQSHNQRLSKMASKFGHLATIDLKAASDTIAIKTVESLLPARWFNVLDILRSRSYVLNGVVSRYEKFSSMGNGFTFELESLIFWALSSACCNYLRLTNPIVSVYGDDIIIPVEAVSLLQITLAFYGFSVNEQKSFSSGPFRESCGAHWYEGKDVKPIFLKEDIVTESDIYKAANSIRRYSIIKGLSFCDRRFKFCWHLLVKMVRKPCMISEGYGDGGFIVNFDEAMPVKARHGVEGYFARSLVTVPISYQSDDHAVLLARLHDGSREMSYGNMTNLRGRTRIVRKRLFVRQWCNLGPWI